MTNKMKNEMINEIQKDLSKVIKKEKLQARLTKYISGIGKWLLFILPIALVGITILSILTTLDVSLTITFYLVLAIYFFNSLMLLLGASKTESSLQARLDFERKRRRPIDSLDGFELLSRNVKRVTTLLKIISLICIVAMILFIVMLIMGDLNLGFAAIGFALIGLGLALLIRSLNLDIHQVNGLQDFFVPSTHQMFLDNFFGDIFSNHLDPITFLKWDEYLNIMGKILISSFVQRVKESEESEDPRTFAIEKILFLYYLKFQGVLNEELFVQELKEVINVESNSFDLEKGILIEGSWYFSEKDIYKLFDYIKKHNPGFFTIIDRLQLELADNIERISRDPIYLDSSSQEVVYLNSELNIMAFLYNNAPEAKRYRLKIVAPGFEPDNIVLNINVEGRGSFIIPNKPLPLTSKSGDDITGVLSTMLENGDTIWVTLEPRSLGEQTIQIFLETSEGVIIEGKTRTVKVVKNLKSQLKKITSLGSILGGLAAPLSRMLLSS